MVQKLDRRFELDIILVPGIRSYMDRLKRKFADDLRIRFLEPFAYEEIVQKTNNYDLGVFLLPPTNLNYRFALPNKLFEFIQARLGIIIGPSPEMAKVVEMYHCGMVLPSFDPAECASALSSIQTRQVAEWKEASHRASSRLAAERFSNRLVENVSRSIFHPAPYSAWPREGRQ